MADVIEVQSTVCIPNIGKAGRRVRLIFGGVFLTVGLVIAVAMIIGQSPWLARAILFFPFVLAFTGIFQAREKT